MSTAPFDPAVAELVTGPHEVRAAAVITRGSTSLEVAVTGGRLSWAESRSPRVQGELVCAFPDDVAALAAVDPNLPTRVAITITYVLPDGTTSSAVVANLGLRTRTVVRPAAELRLRVASDEAMAIDASPGTAISEGGDPPASFTIPDAPAYVANVYKDLVFPYVPTVVNRAAAEAAEWPTDVRHYWDSILEVADTLDLDIYDNGDRVLVIEPRRVTAAESVLALKTGPGGTILDSASVIDRDDFANFVTLRYDWSTVAGVRKILYGTARVDTGPYAVTAIGYTNLAEVRDTPTAQYAADKAAKNVLARMLSRTRGLTLTAVAAWWLRPGHTVTVQLPTGGQDRHLVGWVDFDLEDMTMNLGTRLPDTANPVGE